MWYPHWIFRHLGLSGPLERSHTVTIIDLSHAGSTRVCLAGLLDDGTVVRLVFPHGPTERWCELHGIRPFVRIHVEPWRRTRVDSGSEEWQIDPSFCEIHAVLSAWERRRLLTSLLRPSVPDVYAAGADSSRLLGTIKPRHIDAVQYAASEHDVGACWLAFQDEIGRRHRLATTDLAFRRLLDELQLAHGLAPFEAAARLTDVLRGAEVFLRIASAPAEQQDGLGRVVITGVYAFAEYLDAGRLGAADGPSAAWQPLAAVQSVQARSSLPSRLRAVAPHSGVVARPVLGREKSEVEVQHDEYPGWAVLARDQGHHRGFRFEVSGPRLSRPRVVRGPHAQRRADAVEFAARLIEQVAGPA